LSRFDRTLNRERVNAIKCLWAYGIYKLYWPIRYCGCFTNVHSKRQGGFLCCSNNYLSTRSGSADYRFNVVAQVFYIRSFRMDLALWNLWKMASNTKITDTPRLSM